MKLPEIALRSNAGKDKEVDELISQSQEKTLVVDVNENLTIKMYEIPEEQINEVKYTQEIVRMIRNSSEYKQYIQTIRREFDLNSCRFYDNIDTTDIKMSLEMHHYPASLFDIVHAVRQTHLDNELLDAYKTFTIANDVMRMHYEGKVGLVPLSKTSHELAHNGALLIPLTKDYVFGDYEDLLEDDELTFDDLFYEKFRTITRMTNEYKESGKNITDYLFNSREVEVKMETSHSPMKIRKESEESA